MSPAGEDLRPLGTERVCIWEEIPVESYFYCLFISVDLIRQLRDAPLGICGEPLQQVFRRLCVLGPSAMNDVLKNNKSNQNYMKSFIIIFLC